MNCNTAAIVTCFY